MRILNTNKLIVLILSISCSAFADSKTKPMATPEKTSVKDVMHNFVNSLVEAKAFSTYKYEINDDGNKKTLKALEKLQTSLNEIDPSSLPPSKAYNISLRALQQHFMEIEKAYKYGNQHYARWMLNATGSLCVMCHTQTPSDSRSLTFTGPYTNPNTGEQKFAQAEFLFTTRQFERANQIYETLIKEYPQNGLNTTQLDLALRHRVAYFARVKRTPKEGMKALDQDSKNTKIPEALLQNVSAWKALFNKWSRESDPGTSNSAKSVLKFAKKQLEKTLWDRMTEANDPRIVTYLRVSGVLYDHLFTHQSSPETAEILLILGQCENALNNQFFFSLGDLYFKECIEGFASNPIAKECYRELETSMKKAYSTTTGNETPPFIEMELKNYRTKVGL